MEINNNITPKSYNPNFNGINHIMKKRIYSNPEFLEKLPDIFTRENGNVGTFPNDILHLLKLGTNKNENAVKIKKVQDILNNANIILSEIEVKKLEIADALNIKNFINPFLPKLAKIETQPTRIPRILNEMRKKFTPPLEYITEVSEKAEQYIEKSFKTLGILSKEDKIKLTYLDQGKFKNAFKLEFLNKDGENIIHPKTLLSFKNKSVAQEQFNKIINIIKEYFSNIPEKEYTKTINNIINNASKKVIPESEKEVYRNVLMQLFSNIKLGKGEEKFNDIINKTIIKEMKYNGASAESNITQFIKHAAGAPLDKSNFVPVYYLNQKHNVALSEFSDEMLPAASHELNLHKYGIFHDDVDYNKNNIVAGRVIDYGNIKPLPKMEMLAQNPIVRRYYHKISQIQCKTPKETDTARIKYWNKLYKLASKHQIPNHNDILTALEESKVHISQANWYKLHDSKSDIFGSSI